jgi:hypothetical protein
MKKGTLLYLGMLLLFGSGLEVIRRLGATLTAPHNIAGVWHLTMPSAADPCPILEVGPTVAGELRVEQSGRYLHLIFPDTHHTKFRAYFRDGAFQGSSLSMNPCAGGTPVSLSGRLIDSRLDVVLTRTSQPLRAPVVSLNLSAVRALDVAPGPPTPPQSSAQEKNKE